MGGEIGRERGILGATEASGGFLSLGGVMIRWTGIRVVLGVTEAFWRVVLQL